MASKAKAVRTTTAAGEKKAEPAAPQPEGAAGPAGGEGKLSALAAAAKVLAEAGTALTCKELVGAMAAKGYWASPGGKTPEATLHAAISTEIKKKGDAARFRKAAPGRFAAVGATGTLPPATAGRKAARGRSAPPA
ncbi:MAG TPA: HTH domain-containing protein [Urbifossiella sp.]|nr:HTH domain-containing protein [Urbifossiella sp.]